MYEDDDYPLPVDVRFSVTFNGEVPEELRDKIILGGLKFTDEAGAHVALVIKTPNDNYACLVWTPENGFERTDEWRERYPEVRVDFARLADWWGGAVHI